MIAGMMGGIEEDCARFTRENAHWVATVKLGNYPPRIVLRAYVPSPDDKRYTEVHVGQGIMARAHVPDDWLREISKLAADLAEPRALRPLGQATAGLVYFELRPQYGEFAEEA
jgi:hypothetical protein